MKSFFYLLSYFIFHFLFLYYVRVLSYFSLIVLFLLTLFLFFVFNKSLVWYQVIYNFYYSHFLQISYIIGIDSLSIFFVVLSSFLLMYCFLIYWFLKYKVNFYAFVMLFSLFLFVNVFSSLDLFFFYIYFEGIVIPMFFLVVFEVVVVVKFMRLINCFYIL